MNTSRRPLDSIDLALLQALQKDPRASHAELGRVAQIARGTVYSRLDRLEREGVITDYAPTVDGGAAGYDVLAFTTLEIRQGSHEETVAGLIAIDEVLEVHTITGAGDLLCKIIARSNDHLHRILQSVTAIPTVARSESQLALHMSHRRSVLDVIAAEPSSKE